MGRINYTGVVKGGLLAGVIVNVGEGLLNGVILAAANAAVAERLGAPQTTAVLAMYLLMGMVMGVTLVWIYAAIRPRFGPGKQAAIIAGLLVWFLVYGTYMTMNGALHIYPNDAMALSIVWGMVEMPLAALAGAWLYTEEG